MFTEFRLKIRKFFRKYKNIIVLVVVIWGIIFVINQVLKHQPQKEVLNTTLAFSKCFLEVINEENI